MSIQTPEVRTVGNFGDYGQERQTKFTQEVASFLNAPMSEFELDKAGLEDSLGRVLELAQLADFSSESDRSLINKMTESLAETIKSATPAWNAISQDSTEGHLYDERQGNGSFAGQRRRYDRVQEVVVGMVTRTLEATDPEEVKRLATVTDTLASNLGWSIQVEDEVASQEPVRGLSANSQRPENTVANRHFHMPHWAKKEDLSRVTLARRGVAGIVVAGAVAAGPVIMASSAAAAELPQGSPQIPSSTSLVLESANQNDTANTAQTLSTEQASLIDALSEDVITDATPSAVPAAPTTPAATTPTLEAPTADNQANSLASALSDAVETSPTPDSTDTNSSEAVPPSPSSEQANSLAEALASGAQSDQAQETDPSSPAETPTPGTSSNDQASSLAGALASGTKPAPTQEADSSNPTTDAASPNAPSTPVKPAHKAHHAPKHHEKLSHQEVSQRALNKMKRMGPNWHNRAVVMEVLMDHGWKPDHAAGAIGNLCVEAAGCDLNPRINQIGYSGSDEGMGIGQWTKNGRWQTLLSKAREWGMDPMNIRTQARFIDWEVRNTERMALGPISNSHGTDQATYAFSKYYERPADVSASIVLRQKYAHETMAMYQKSMQEVRHEARLAARQKAHHEEHRSHFNGPLSGKGYTTPIDPKLYVQEIGKGTGYNGYHNIPGVHTGVDIPVHFVPFRAIKGGTVVRADQIGLGIYAVEVKQDDGLYAVYQHVDPGKIAVHPGEHVAIGQHLGLTGNSGYPVASTGPHLHVSIQTQEAIASKSDSNVFQETNNPMDYLPSKQHVEQWLHQPDKSHGHDNGHANNDHGPKQDQASQPASAPAPPSPTPSATGQDDHNIQSQAANLVQQLSSGAEANQADEASSQPAPSVPASSAVSAPEVSSSTDSAPTPSAPSDSSEPAAATTAPGNSAQGHANGNANSHDDSHGSAVLDLLDAIAGL